jgi:sugar/nucleoside kinase (ribokinase family)
MKPILFAAGYLNQDILAVVDRLPEMGGRVTAAAIDRASGGMTANLACAAARLGLSVCFFGRVGQDAAGTTALAELAQFGVDVSWVSRTEQPTTTAIVLIDPQGDRAIISEPTEFDYRPLTQAIATVQPPACVHVDGYRLPGAIGLLQQARARGCTTSADLDGLELADLPAVAAASVPYLDLVFLNRRLAAGLANDPQQVVQQLLQWGAQVVSVTLGDRGALVAAADQQVEVPALVDAIVQDTTGAGDVYAGAFLAAWLQGQDLASAARFAVVASGISLDSRGARGHLPTAAEVQQRQATGQFPQKLLN